MPPAAPSTTTRRARRLVAVVGVSALVSIAASCQQAKPPPPPAPPGPQSVYCAPDAPDTAGEYQAAFNGLRAANTAHWVAADGGLPANIDNGRVLWMFGDTILGAPPNGPLKSNLLVNNGFVVQKDSCFTPMTEPIPDIPGTNHWIWPTGAVIENNVLRVVGSRMRPAPGFFPFDLVRMEVATFSLPDLKFLSRTPLPLPTSPSSPPPNPNYGEALMVDDGWIYAFGHISEGPFLWEQYVARAPVNQLLDPNGWEFWNDDLPLVPGVLDDPSEGWVPDPTAADPMVFENGEDPLPGTDEGPTAAFPVANNPAGDYFGSAFRVEAFAKDFIETWRGTTPQGPWTLHARAVDITKPPYGPLTDEQLAYGGRVVFGIPGAPVALWSTNHESFDAVLANPNLYKVWFAQPAPGSIP